MKKLLVADDSLTIQKVIRLALSNEGYDIQTVSTGSDAVQEISLFRPDVVLIDISLPEKSAIEIKKWTDQQDDFYGIKFILMSSAFEQVDEQKIAVGGFHGRLVKPFDPAHLRQVLADAMQTSSAEQMEVEEDITAELELPEKGPESKLKFPPPRPEVLAKTKQPAAKKIEPKLSEPKPSVPKEIEIEERTADIEIPKPAMRSQRPDSGGGEEDIRQLTESTIKMSGLDDYQWTINEPGKEIPLPSSSTADPIELELSEAKNFTDHEPFLSPTSKMRDDGGTTFSIHAENEGPEIPEMPLPRESGVSQQEIEKMVAQHLEKILGRMIQRVIPDIAEKIIKEEIHQLLENPPA